LSGIAGHGRYRVVTEKTMVGMPENIIGLLPDIGFAYLANRIPGHIGLYMALAGKFRLNTYRRTKATLACTWPSQVIFA
jgi:enoyl-CoA hydratase/carnithine racemase